MLNAIPWFFKSNFHANRGITYSSMPPTYSPHSLVGGQAPMLAAVLPTSHLPCRYETISGTSMATPHVSAVAALVWAKNPTCSADQVRCALTATALDLGAPGRDHMYGYGLVQAAAAHRELQCDSKCGPCPGLICTPPAPYWWPAWPRAPDAPLSPPGPPSPPPRSKAAAVETSALRPPGPRPTSSPAPGAMPKPPVAFPACNPGRPVLACSPVEAPEAPGSYQLEIPVSGWRGGRPGSRG